MPKVFPRNVEELARTRREIVAFEQDFLAERFDAVRARAAEAWILSEVSGNAKGLQLTSLEVECRATLCRVQMAFPRQILEKQGPPLPRGTVWTGKEPIGFFIEALDVEFRVGHLFGGLDSSGAPLVVGYASMPAQSAGR